MTTAEEGLTVVNLAHPLDDRQLAQIAEKAGLPVREVIDVKVELDPSAEFAEAAQFVDAAGLDARDWQQRPIAVNLPGHAVIAAVVLAELHGRIGSFPTVIRLVRRDGPILQWDVAELVNLQALREEARRRR